MENIPTLSYLSFEVIKVLLDRGSLLTEKNGDFSAKVQYRWDASEHNKNNFDAIFIVTIDHSIASDFYLQLEAYGKFTINGNADENLYDNYTEISAPAIVYPYLRAFVSTLMLQAGLGPIFLPPLNFVNRRNRLANHEYNEENTDIKKKI